MLVHSSTDRQQLPVLIAESKQPLYFSGIHLCSDLSSFLDSDLGQQQVRTSYMRKWYPVPIFCPKLGLPAAAREAISPHHS